MTRFVRNLLLGLVIFSLSFGALALASPRVAHALTDDEKAALQAQYNELQQEIAQWQQVLDDTKAKKNSLQGDVTTLNAQIAQATAEIKQRNDTIDQLAGDINDKSAQISQLEDSIASGEESLAKLLRQKEEAQAEPLALLALSSESLSTFFSDINDIDSVNRDLQAKFDQLNSDKNETQTQKDALDAQKNQQLDAVHDVQVKKDAIADDQTQKKQLLAITTQDEVAYQKVLSDRQTQAATIRAALFPLRDAAAINFGDALGYAQAAQKTTGVDPALVLAILTQESNLGSNVGQCYLTDNGSGAGIRKDGSKSYPNVMNPTRDVPPFILIAQQLGFDPHSQVVSCPIASAGGWGGAMGPAQFIASTWALYANKIAAARGESIANPWDPGDAIEAMSLLLAGAGASTGTYSASRTAAAKYYAGSNYAGSAGQAYANQVMAKVDDIQKNISFLTDNGL